MSYNVYIERKHDGDNDYYAFLLEGEGISVHRTACMPFEDNTKFSYLSACCWAFTQIKALLDYKVIQRYDLVFYCPYRTMASYFAYFIGDVQHEIKPPKKYYDAVYNAYLDLELLGCTYSVDYASWATNARRYATARAYEQQGTIKREKAIDAFKNFVEEGAK